MQLAVLTRLVV